jgi:methylenetetrahydrofolate dehydrogenase (NADP+)/methenyltetrahydrofolate cyclohydrolase
MTNTADAGTQPRTESPAARIIDGKALAATVGARLTEAVKHLKEAHGLEPGLAVVLVGNNAASEVYVRSKVTNTTAVGMHSSMHTLPETVTEVDLLNLIARLNADPSVHGILVQLPLPAQVDSRKVIEAIDPRKDVDGFHPLNAGLLSTGLPGLRPCTPLACIMLARTVHASLAGLEAVIVGRSNIVGKPLAQLLLNENATVTICHSRSRDLPEICRRADLLFAAVGQPELVRASWVKPGATVIDVGINRVSRPDGKQRLVGDVAFAEAQAVAGAITPVPGGVGPMTIACLLANTLRAACAIARLPQPEI